MAEFSFKNGPSSDLSATLLETERLRLVGIREDHAPDIFREFSPEVARYMLPKPAAALEETLHFIWDSRARVAAGRNLQLVILDKDSGEFLGCCGVHPGEAAPELGIWLKTDAHGQGYGKEAIRGLLRWASEHLAADRLIYPVDHRNIPSRRIPESLGGVLIGERAEMGAAGNRLELLVYRVPLTPSGTAPG